MKNRLQAILWLSAVLMLIGVCSCGFFEKKKTAGAPAVKAPAFELPASDIAQMESYRDYISKNLPFKKINWESVFRGEKVLRMSRYGDSLYVETNARRLYSVNVKTGFRQWQVQLPAQTDFFISIVGDLPKQEAELRKSLTLIENEIAGESRRKDRDEDKLKSMRRQFQALQQEFVSLRMQDVLYLTCQGALYCIDRSVGTVLWKTQLAFVPGTPPASTIKSVFIGSLDFYRIYQVDTELKYEKDWYKAADSISTRPIYENPVLYFGSRDGKVYAYNTIERKLFWSFQTERGIAADMLLDDDILYVGSTDFAIYGLDRYAGVILWKFETGSSVTASMKLDKIVTKVVAPGKVSDTDLGHNDSGKMEDDFVQNIQDVVSKTLYVYSDDNGLYALDLEETSILIRDDDPSRADREKVIRRANPRWKFRDGKHFLMRGQNRIYVMGIDNNTLYALGSGTILEVKEKYNLALFPARYNDIDYGTLYISSHDGYLFSVQEP